MRATQTINANKTRKPTLDLDTDQEARFEVLKVQNWEFDQFLLKFGSSSQ